MLVLEGQVVCVCVCVRACVRACVRVCVCVFLFILFFYALTNTYITIQHITPEI